MKDGGLDEFLKKIEGIGAFDGPLPALRATKSTMPATSKAAARKEVRSPFQYQTWLVLTNMRLVARVGLAS